MYSPTTFTQYDGVAVYGSINNNNFTSLTLPVFTMVAVNTTANLGPVTVQVPDGATNLRVGVFSVYSGPSSATVSMTFDTTTAANFVGTAFSSDFGGLSENTFATYIQGAAGGSANAISALESFFNTYNGDFPAVNTVTNTASGSIVTFSNGALGGTASLSLSAVPEPSTYALLGVGVAALGFALRRRTTREKLA